jgi:hypothetical protein
MGQKDQGPELDLFGNVTTLPATVQRVISTSVEISQEPPDRADFLHSVLCQVGMPRKATEGRVFERWQGGVGLRLEAGSIGLNGRFVEQPLPYGVKPRLVMIHISTEAVRRQSPIVPMGDSMRGFLETLGLESSGGRNGTLTMFKKQMLALVGCRMTLSTHYDGRDRTIYTQPIDRFDAWLSTDTNQRSLWAAELELSQRFYETLVENAVPLDYRALAALKHSSLSLDVYSWLAHRLCRVRKADGVKLSWDNLREQFGQEYTDPKNFKKEFRQSLRQALAVYPDARIEDVPGGLRLRASKPPLAKTQIVVLNP